MLTKEDLFALDEAIRATLVARKKDLNMSDEAIGNLAFKGIMANPSGKVQAIFKGQGAGDKRKPQSLRIGDAMNLCEALGLLWVDVFRQAVKEVKRKQ